MISPVSLPSQAGLHPTQPGARPPASKGPSFADVLTDTMKATRPVRVSAHAAQRLQSRGIHLSDERLAQVGEALDQLAEKGGKEALLMLGDVSLVASVTNRTIITAVAFGGDQASIFTNIDSAAVLPSGTADHAPDQPIERADAALNATNRPDPLRGAWAPRNDRRGAII